MSPGPSYYDGSVHLQLFVTSDFEHLTSVLVEIVCTVLRYVYRAHWFITFLFSGTGAIIKLGPASVKRLNHTNPILNSISMAQRKTASALAMKLIQSCAKPSI